MENNEKGKPGRDAMIRFIRVQKSGICNMLSKRVQLLAELTDEEHHYIIAHYPELCEEYNLSAESPEVCGGSNR